MVPESPAPDGPSSLLGCGLGFTMPRMRGRQTDRHIGITGAGTGIGLAIATRLGAEGARLSLFGRREGPLREAEAAVREAGAPAVVVHPVDIRDRSAIDAAIGHAAAELGPLHAFVANAGLGGPNEAGDGDRWDDLVGTNLTGTYLSLRAAQRNLASSGRRDLLMVSSILARIGVSGYTRYCASKAGLLGLCRALAMELAPEGIQVNALCPGWVDTSMAREGIAGMAQGMDVSLEEAHRIAMQEVPLGRMSQPTHIAGLVAWLLSEDGTGVTGQALDMNNGAFMN